MLKRVYQSLHSNDRGADNSEPIIASLPSNEQQTLILLLLRAFRGFYGFNSYCMGTKHATLIIVSLATRLTSTMKIEAGSSSEKLVSPNRLHGITSQKTVILIATDKQRWSKISIDVWQERSWYTSTPVYKRRPASCSQELCVCEARLQQMAVN
jgi:hypothetical protein